MKVKTNGIEINYEVEGNGPWLTMSHSLACNLHMWDPQMPVLTKKFKVLRFDTRGHGQSSVPAGEYNLDQMADDVKGLLDSLKIKQTHWAGLSMGGMIGQAFALKYPGVFQSMVLADTASRRPPEAAKMWGDRIKIAREQGMEALVESTLARWFTEPYRNSHKDVMKRIGDDIRNTPVNGFVGCSAALGDHDFRPLMPKVKNPVLWMCGEKDGHNAAAMKVMQDELPGSQYVVLPGAGHISNMDQPEMFTRNLRDFLKPN